MAHFTSFFHEKCTSAWHSHKKPDFFPSGCIIEIHKITTKNQPDNFDEF
jgi:hypothetical protein